MSAVRGAGPRDLRHRVRALHDLLVQFGVGQDRQQLRCPPRHAIVAPALAGAALAQVPCYGQPKGSRQHHDAWPAALPRIAVMPSVSQYLSQFPAPGSITTWRVHPSFPGRERGDLESAQYRLPVLAAQPPNLGNVGPQFPCRVPAIQASCHEQIEEPLPGLGQRGHDLLKPALQRCPPGGRVLHLESRIDTPPVACRYRRHPHSWPAGSDRQQDATTCVPARLGIMDSFVHSCS